MTASFTRTRDELKEKIESTTTIEEELSKLKAEYADVKDNYETYKANFEKKTEAYQQEINRLREDYANKERDFQHISAVTVGLSPVKAALRKYETEILRLQNRIKFLETGSPDYKQNGDNQIASDPVDKAEEINENHQELPENIESKVENKNENQEIEKQAQTF
jgi:chromosome segregation ATPase